MPSLDLRCFIANRHLKYNGGFLTTLLVLLLYTYPAFAAEIGTSGDIRFIGRLHGDSDSIGSEITLEKK
ncbi:MAG: hypothetical protein OEY59_13340, partial [Deltaproteobacteria bacterium]|nr:hypothetical protein [Deltaproteobacteria bacterium]